MVGEEVRTHGISISDVMTKVTKARWQLIVQEAMILSLQRNQAEQHKLSIKEYDDTK